MPRVMAEKKGEVARMEACAAKRRSEGPMARVRMGEVKVLRVVRQKSVSLHQKTQGQKEIQAVHTLEH